jgi:hypothetical protein
MARGGIKINSHIASFFSQGYTLEGASHFIEKGQDGSYNANRINPIQTQRHLAHNANHNNPNNGDSPCIIS